MNELSPVEKLEILRKRLEAEGCSWSMTLMPGSTHNEYATSILKMFASIGETPEGRIEIPKTPQVDSISVIHNLSCSCGETPETVSTFDYVKLLSLAKELEKKLSRALDAIEELQPDSDEKGYELLRENGRI